MRTFLYIIGKIFDVILFPFKALPPFIGFIFISIVTGFLAVYLFKHVSDQKSLKRLMGRIKLHFMEIILYRDDIGQILTAQKEILKNNLLYFLKTIKPAIPIMATVLLIVSQVNIRYSFAPLSPGDLVSVKVKMGGNPVEVELLLPGDVEIVTPAFHLAGDGQVEWQVQGKKNGKYLLTFRSGQETVTKEFLVGPPSRPFSPHLGKQGVLEAFFNPIEAPLPKDGPIQSIDLVYKARSFTVWPFGWHMHWLAAFLVIAIAFGLICRKILKVS